MRDRKVQILYLSVIRHNPNFTFSLRLPLANNGVKRKLRAILDSDVKGYSKLMGQDDESTVSTVYAVVFLLDI
jgi:hypothetical protein